MLVYQPELSKLLLFLQFIAAVTAILYFKKNKNNYWKWFSIYLVFIYLQESFSQVLVDFLAIEKENYFAYFGIPIEFLFWFWLYALKSLKSLKLFVSCTGIYFLSFLPINIFFDSSKIVYSFNYTVGTLLLLYLVSLEFYKQIKNDSILEFNENKMFYINIGVVLFYVGTLPFFGLYKLILKDIQIWNNYYIYFLISNCIMYLLFTASIIWGKPKL